VTAVDDSPAQGPGKLLLELGFSVEGDGDEMRGTATITPHMHAPGTGQLRTSILAAWTDLVAGMGAVEILYPKIPVTLDLEVHLFEPPPGAGRVEVVGRPLKLGRSINVLHVDLLVNGALVGVGTAAFVQAPDPELRMDRRPTFRRSKGGSRLAMPFAERAGIVSPEPGTAVIPNGPEARNGWDTLSGGLTAVVIEEAALSLTPGASLALLDMHYLQPVRVGPAIARADVRKGVGRVEVRDAGADDRLAVIATTRTFGDGR
jgi:acyl-coenzyme A thioesterase PaaI-like protein